MFYCLVFVVVGVFVSSVFVFVVFVCWGLYCIVFGVGVNIGVCKKVWLLLL